MIKKIIFDVDDVISSLISVTSVVNQKNALPILGDVLLYSHKQKGEDGKQYMTLLASDGEIWVRKNVEIDGESDQDLSICLNAKSFAQAIGNLQGKRVVMNVDMEKMSIKCDYGNGYFSIPFEGTDAYPQPSKVNGEKAMMKEIPTKNLLDAINSVGYAVGNDELRPILNGVHFDFFNEGMVSVATDSRRLAKHIDHKIQTQGEEATSFNLPKKPCQLLVKMMQEGDGGDVSVSFDEKVATFTSKHFVVTTRLIEGNYPKYDLVIPQDNNIVVDINKESFVSALKRIAPMANVSTELVMIELEKDFVVVSCEDIDYQKSATENIPCRFDGENVKIGFSASNLMTTIQNINGEFVRLALKDASHAGLFYETTPQEECEYLSLLMPMKF